MTRQERLTVARVSATLVIAYLPLFLLGTAAPQMLADTNLGLTVGGLGVAVLASRIVAAAGAQVAGKVTGRVGTRTVETCAMTLSAASLLGAGAAGSSSWLMAAAAVGGAAGPLAQVAANVTLSEDLGPESRPVAYAVKQSAMPASILVSGGAAAVAAATYGWRTLMITCCGLAVGAATARALSKADGGRDAGGSGADGGGRRLTAGTGTLAAAFGLAMASALSLGAYAAVAAEQAGWTAAGAAAVVSLGAAASITARLTAGRLVRTRGHDPLKVAGAMLVAGSSGHLAMAHGGRTAVAAGIVVAYALAWGFNALVAYGAAEMNPGNVAKASALMLSISSLAGIAGPAAAAWALGRHGGGAAWTGTAVAAAVAGTVMLRGRRPERAEA